MKPYTHWACFNCRKSFKYLQQAARLCTKCGEEMRDMGYYFEPPRQRDKKSWSIMKLIWESGYRFQTERAKAFIKSFILMSKRPRIEDVRDRINQVRRREQTDSE